MSMDWQGEAPSITVLWDKRPKARRPHLCDRCNDEVAVGQQYESRGWREDGEFKSEKLHLFAHRYPSGCPSIKPRDIAEINGAYPNPTSEATHKQGGSHD